MTTATQSGRLCGGRTLRPLGNTLTGTGHSRPCGDVIWKGDRERGVISGPGPPGSESDERSTVVARGCERWVICNERTSLSPAGAGRGP